MDTNKYLPSFIYHYRSSNDNTFRLCYIKADTRSYPVIMQLAKDVVSRSGAFYGPGHEFVIVEANNVKDDTYTEIVVKVHQ